MASIKRPRVVIVGAGFGGLWTARTLAGSTADVLLLDRDNYHSFLPLLYQVAAAELEPEEIIYPVRSILRKLSNVSFMLGEVTKLDPASKAIEVDGSIIPYDYLVVASGSISHFFGVPGAEEHAFSLKTVEEGVVLRNSILCSFEQAINEADVDRRRRLLTFTIVGGGPTGVEFAGALSELIQGPLPRDYPTLDFEKEVRILVLEAADTLLSGLSERLQTYASERLQRMGAQIRLGAVVSEIKRESVLLKDGTVIPTETVIWTAGVRGDTLAQTSGLPVARAGRVEVQPTLQVPGYPSVYVVGDLAYVEEDGRPLPMVAPVAVQEGVAAAQNILRQISGEEQLPFRYNDRGTMAAIGRNAAVARLGTRSFTGFIAWLLWLVVHLFNLIGFRNRLLVMLNWSLDYFLFERAVRFIFPSGLIRDSKTRQCRYKRRSDSDDEG